LKQLPDQKKLIDLQVKLAEKQLKQYEETEKKEAMLKGPANFITTPRPPPPPPPPSFASSITTRSMARVGTLGTQLTPARNIGFSNPAFVESTHTPNSLISNVRPPTPLTNFGLGRAIEIELNELRHRPPAVNPALQVGLNLPDANLGYNATGALPMQQEQPQPRIGYFNRFSNYLRQFRNMGYQNLDATGAQQQLPWRQSMQQRIAAIRERTAQWRLPRFKIGGGGDEMRARLIEVGRRGPRGLHGSTMGRYAKRTRKFIQRHKRGILYGLGATGIGVGAVLTGIYATKRNNKKKGQKEEEEDMREGSTGTLGSLIKGDSYGFGGGGGGGGGGFGSYYPPPPRRLHRRKGKRQQQIVKGGRVVKKKKKKQQQQQRQERTTKKSKYMRKRKSISFANLSINKRRQRHKQKKHIKKNSKRFAAF
jgi:hypothetical protein